jgi:hypothetical protein
MSKFSPTYCFWKDWQRDGQYLHFISLLQMGISSYSMLL